MHPLSIDTFIGRRSPIHRLPAGLKLFSTIILILAVSIDCPARMFVWAAIAGVLVAIARISTIPSSFLVRRILIIDVFVAGTAGLWLLLPGGADAFLILLARSTLNIFTLLLFVTTTPFPALLHMLRRARVPLLIVTLLSLMYRFLFVFVDELERMRRARASRTFSGTRRIVWWLQSSAIAQLFIRSVDRAEGVLTAMHARGWQ